MQNGVYSALEDYIHGALFVRSYASQDLRTARFCSHLATAGKKKHMMPEAIITEPET